MNGEVYNPADFSAIDWSQGTGMSDWTSSHVRAFEFFSGVTAQCKRPVVTLPGCNSTASARLAC